MFSNTQDAGKEIYAGLYLRAKRQLRSLNWSRGRSKKELTNCLGSRNGAPVGWLGGVVARGAFAAR